MDAFHKSFNKESFGGEIVEIMDLQANDCWTKPCKWAAHNEERRNTMKTNFQWKFMPRRCHNRQNAGNCQILWIGATQM